MDTDTEVRLGCTALKLLTSKGVLDAAKVHPDSFLRPLIPKSDDEMGFRRKIGQVAKATAIPSHKWVLFSRVLRGIAQDDEMDPTEQSEMALAYLRYYFRWSADKKGDKEGMERSIMLKKAARSRVGTLAKDSDLSFNELAELLQEMLIELVLYIYRPKTQ